MATIDNRTGSATGKAIGQYPAYVKVNKQVDFSETPQSAGQLIQLINVPADTFVAMVTVNCLTAEGATLTYGIGDADSATGYIAAANGNSAGTSACSAGVGSGVANALGKHYDSAGVIGITPNHDADTAVIQVCVWMANTTV